MEPTSSVPGEAAVADASGLVGNAHLRARTVLALASELGVTDRGLLHG